MSSLAWSYLTVGDVQVSPTVADGQIYIGTTTNRIYALTQEGAFAWSYESGDDVISSPAIGADRQLYVGSLDNALYCLKGPTETPTPSPYPTPAPSATPFYVELRVAANPSGGGQFVEREQVVLEWATYEDRYGYPNVPCLIYLAAAKAPLAEDTVIGVAQALQNGALFIFDGSLNPLLYTGGNINTTYRNVPFPHPRLGSSGQLIFTVPKGATGRWVFMCAFIRTDNSQFPAQPPVEVSNGFNLN